MPAVRRPLSHTFTESNQMKRRTILFAVVFCFFAAALSFAADDSIGTWKLNEAKSKFPASAGKNSTVVYSAEGDNLKAVIDGVDGSGNPVHSEWVGKFDGKDYPVTGDSRVDARSVKMVDDHHFKVANKKDGKVVLEGSIAIAPDGKSRVLKVAGKNADGKKTSATYVYDKE